MQKKFYTFLISFLYCANIFGQQTCVIPKITDSFGKENPVIDCNYALTGKCLTLTATYPNFNETTSYAVDSETFSPYGAFNSGTALNADGDDLFLKKILIPFNFCFFGNSFNELVIGSNGVITFDSSQLGNINYPNIQVSNPNPSLPLNAIFGVMQDLVFSKNDDSEIFYTVIGAAPCRKLVINFYKGRIVGCDQISTSQIVLSESSNEIEVFVDEKPLACGTAKFKESLIGINNADGSLGYSPTGRNTGVWSAEKEAYKFTPNGAIIIPEVNWYNSDNQNIGTGNSITVCPEKNENYTVKVSYNICGNSNVLLENTSAVTFAPDFPVAQDFNKIFCGNSNFNVNLDDYLSDLTPQNPNNLIFTFHNSLVEAQTGTNPQPKNFFLNGNRTYFVRIQNASNPLCFRTSVLNLTLISNSLITDKLQICDTNNDGIEKKYQLSLFNLKLFSAPLNGTIHYFLSQTDANNGLNEVTSTDIVSGTQLFVNYQTPGCSQIFGPITISFLSSPAINSPIDFKFTTCDFKNDGVELFDFQTNISPLISTNPALIFKYYNTYAEANAGNGSGLTNIIERKYKIFARVEIAGGCFSIAEINMDVTFTKIEAKDKSVFLCFDGTQDVTVNLEDYALLMLVDPAEKVTPTYFINTYDADADENPISNIQIITGNGNLVSKNFYVKLTDSTGCYALKRLTINLVHVIVAKSNFTACDFKNNGEENVNLNSYKTGIIGSQNASVTYFSTLIDAQKDTNPITSVLVTNTKKLYIRILSYGCFDIFEININLTPTPIVQPEISIVKNSVCDNNNDGEENFDLTQLQSQIYTGSDAVLLSYYTNYNPADNSFSGLISDPQNFPVKGSATVFAKVTFSNGGCYSASKINVKLNFLGAISLKNAILQKCDFEFDLNEIFTLNDAIPQLFTQSENPNLLSDLAVTYYASEADANEGDVPKQINSPYTTSVSDITVWARFTSKTTFCYSVAGIRLQTYLPPKAINSTISNICDDNVGGIYEVNLNNFTSEMASPKSPDNHFVFFHTQSDAKLNQNPIINPQNFSENPFPTQLWVRVENIPGCFDTAPIDFTFGTKIVLKDLGPFTVKNTCDIGNDGSENIDLTQFQNQIYTGIANFEYYPSELDLNQSTNKIDNPQTYLFNENSGSKTIVVKISVAGFCPEKVQINLSLKKTPIFTLPDYYFCPEGFVNIQPDFSGLNIEKFEWKDSSGKIVSTNNELPKIKTEGVYTINVTAKNDCTFSTTFNVYKYEIPIIKNLIFNGNSATVIATGSQNILYSIDGIHYQTSNIINDLPAGVITFYVKFSGSVCVGITKQGLVLNLINAFSPNGDGINETWIVDNLYVFEGEKTSLKIFDRYQKLIYTQENASRLEWNGKVANHAIPTDSYWYILTLPDGRLFSGWILLKNRN